MLSNWPVPTTWALGSTVAILLLATLACQTVLSTPRPTPHPEISAILAGFTEAQGEPEASFDALEGWIDEDPAAVQWAALDLVEDEALPVRFAATYALAETAEARPALAALEALLTDEHLSIRVLAAEALLVRGEPGALPVLIDALDEQDPLHYSHPPYLAWEYARQLLITYTREDFGLRQARDAAQAAQAQEAWRAWWEQNDVVWDEAAFAFVGRAP